MGRKRVENNKTSQKERLDIIRNAVKTEKKVVVSKLSACFNVTEETIRRDLEKLEQEGLVNRTYGGAVLNMGEITEKIDYVRRAQRNPNEKKTIGLLAAGLIPERATISMDASTTVVEAVKNLKDHSGITILTNSVQAVLEMGDSQANMILTGGNFNHSTSSMQGSITRKTLSSYYVNILLISCKAIDPNGGFMDTNEEEADLKRIMARHAQKVFLLADHSKFNKVAFTQLLDFDQIDVLVTDRKPGDDWMKIFRENDVEVVYPQNEN